MTQGIDYAALLAGLGFFLLGMNQLEDSLKGLVGRSVKLFIRRYTNSPLQGIVVGTVTTAILQSSSLVTLMLLAFVGAGILSLANAIGVVLGANLGTTVTGWLVTAIGFKLDLEAAAFPLIGIGAIGNLFVTEGSRRARFSQLLLALGFLLFGLGLMKDGVQAYALSVDISFLRELGLVPFAIVAFALTALIRSSSAAMMINLSALAADTVTLPQAAAFAIGADLGTTITVLMGAIRGVPAKRQVALAHFLFNLAVDAVALALLYPLLFVIRNVFGVADPLFALVAFHSTFNLLGIVLFLPFAKPFARFLSRRFAHDTAHIARFIHQVPAGVTDAGIEALRRETQHLFERVLALNSSILRLAGVRSPFTENDSSGYEAVKELEGEILVFIEQVQEQKLAPEETAQLAQLQLAVRHAVQSAKALKDVRHNLLEFSTSVKDALHARYESFRGQAATFYARVEPLRQLERAETRFAELAALGEENRRHYEEQMHDIYRNARRERLEDVEVSTLLNVNRELYSSNKALLIALKDFLLPPRAAEELAALPGLA